MSTNTIGLVRRAMDELEQRGAVVAVVAVGGGWAEATATAERTSGTTPASSGQALCATLSTTSGA
jgi:hypothetical protein